MLVSIHTLLASATDIKELQLSEDEAKMLLKASNDVARHYASGALNQKYVDWAHLMSVVGAVYGSRFMAYRYRVAAAAARDVTPSRPAAPQQPKAGQPTQADLDMMSALHSVTQ